MNSSFSGSGRRAAELTACDQPLRGGAEAGHLWWEGGPTAPARLLFHISWEMYGVAPNPDMCVPSPELSFPKVFLEYRIPSQTLNQWV